MARDTFLLRAGEAAQSRTHFTSLRFFQSICSLSCFKSGTHFTFYSSSFRASIVFLLKSIWHIFAENRWSDQWWYSVYICMRTSSFNSVSTCAFFHESFSVTIAAHTWKGKPLCWWTRQQIEETAPFSSVRPPKLSDSHLPSNDDQVWDYLQTNSKKSHSW